MTTPNRLLLITAMATFFFNIKVVWESQNEALTYILSLEGVLYMICPAQSYIIFRDRGSEWTIVG
jgi:hypothetical protein